MALLNTNTDENTNTNANTNTNTGADTDTNINANTNRNIQMKKCINREQIVLLAGCILKFQCIVLSYDSI